MSTNQSKEVMDVISTALKNAEAQIQSKLSWIFSSSNKEVPIEKKEIALGPREIYDYFKIKDKNKKEELKKFYFYIVENKIITDKNIDFYESFRRFNAEVKSQKKFAGDYSTYLITSSPISTPLVNSIGNTSQGNTNTMSSTSSVSGNASFYKKKEVYFEFKESDMPFIAAIHKAYFSYATVNKEFPEDYEFKMPCAFISFILINSGVDEYAINRTKKRHAKLGQYLTVVRVHNSTYVNQSDKSIDEFKNIRTIKTYYTIQWDNTGTGENLSYLSNEANLVNEINEILN